MRMLGGQSDISSLHSNSELDRVGYQDELIIELVLLCSVIYPPIYGLSRVEPLTNNRLSYLSRMLPTQLLRRTQPCPAIQCSPGLWVSYHSSKPFLSYHDQTRSFPPFKTRSLR
jgi:hypothetical protein